MLVVIGTSPFVDTSVVAGPFRSPAAAAKASDDMTALGYNAEVAPCWRVADLEPLEGAPSDNPEEETSDAH